VKNVVVNSQSQLSTDVKVTTLVLPVI